jgi:hypothetical protein
MNIEEEIANILAINVNDLLFYNNTKWKLKFVWFPTRCDLSKKIMWLTYAYQGTSTYYLPVDMSMNKRLVVSTRWITKQEFIFGKIKGTI